jgi:hypothetical protein
VVIALVLARSTIGRDLFNEWDAQIWAPWQKAPMSWVIAVFVGTVITVAAVRSSRDPFRRHRERLVAGSIAATGVMELALSWLAVVIGMVVAIFSGATYLEDGFVDWYQPVQLVVLVVIALVVALPSFRRSAARSIAWASTLYLIPVLVVTVFFPAPLPGVSVATSVQVTVVLLIAALALAMWNAVLPTRRVGWRVVARLAIVPFVVVHAGLLLPAVLNWSARYVLVAAGVVSLMFLLPKIAADPRRRALDLIGASSGVLLGVIVAVLALPSIFKDEVYTVFGTLWLSVTVITGLVLELQPRAAAGDIDTVDDPRAVDVPAA